MSGYFLLYKSFGSTLFNSKSKTTRIFAGHGDADPLISIDLASSSIDKLQSLGVSGRFFPILTISVDFKTYHGMKHSVCQQELQDLANFIATTMK